MLSDEEVKKCWEFAHQVTELRKDSYLKKDPTRSIEKMIEHHAIGKMVEFWVHHWFEERGHVVSKPDLSIKGKNDFDADLHVLGKGINLHVKHTKPFFSSWLFDKNDPIVINPSTNDFLVLCTFHSGKHIQVNSVTSAGNNNFFPPIKSHIKDKVGLYWHHGNGRLCQTQEEFEETTKRKV